MYLHIFTGLSVLEVFGFQLLTNWSEPVFVFLFFFSTPTGRYRCSMPETIWSPSLKNLLLTCGFSTPSGGGRWPAPYSSQVRISLTLQVVWIVYTRSSVNSFDQQRCGRCRFRPAALVLPSPVFLLQPLWYTCSKVLSIKCISFFFFGLLFTPFIT